MNPVLERFRHAIEIARGQAAGPRAMLIDAAKAQKLADEREAPPLFDPAKASTFDPIAELAKALEFRRLRSCQ